MAKFPQNNANKKKRRKKPCLLCGKGIELVDYKDVELLSKYVNSNYKIVSRRISGNCSKHQTRVANAIKRARQVGLMPFVNE